LPEAQPPQHCDRFFVWRVGVSIDTSEAFLPRVFQRREARTKFNFGGVLPREAAELADALEMILNRLHNAAVENRAVIPEVEADLRSTDAIQDSPSKVLVEAIKRSREEG
jgi:hypothetical protein